MIDKGSSCGGSSNGLCGQSIRVLIACGAWQSISTLMPVVVTTVRKRPLGQPNTLYRSMVTSL